MRITRAALLVITAEIVCANQSVAPPALARSDSRWNVLAYGGKGEMHGAPICNALAYFSGSPLSLDFDGDFSGAKPDDLITTAKETRLGTMAGRRVFEVMLTVRRGTGASPNGSDVNLLPTIKILIVERRKDEFCDIYQQQYAYDQTNETDEAGILYISGRKILKTYETDRHTWFLTYWAMDERGPLRLKTDALYTAIRSVSPTGAQAFGDALNLSGSDFTVNVYKAEPDQALLGRVDLRLSVYGNKILAVSKKWTPARDFQ